ncbi:hypothetical protein K470DRAFT_260590 [Piedraia hortae CBS 480.64]|uniref:Uncharacterized protein n=1 Tax=Piedraia hortae CBS 480.64 TaxID=1314780 RepID=A0A6A7BQV7_9PEZI|nr:hypothetical protein K470DRAFT_260590 [Piedraia hortae CBS 480.64]
MHFALLYIVAAASMAVAARIDEPTTIVDITSMNSEGIFKYARETTLLRISGLPNNCNFNFCPPLFAKCWTHGCESLRQPECFEAISYPGCEGCKVCQIGCKGC